MNSCCNGPDFQAQEIERNLDMSSVLRLARNNPLRLLYDEANLMPAIRRSLMQFRFFHLAARLIEGNRRRK